MTACGEMITGEMKQNVLTSSLLSQANALSMSRLSVFRSFVSKSGTFGPEAEGQSGVDSGTSIIVSRACKNSSANF